MDNFYNWFRNNRLQEKVSAIDAEMSSFCCLPRLMFLVQKTAHAIGGCQEAPGLAFASGGYPFFQLFSEAICPQKNTILNDSCSQNGSNMRSFGSYFSKKTESGKVGLDCAGVHSLHMSPSLGALRATHKSKKQIYRFQNRVL